MNIKVGECFQLSNGTVLRVVWMNGDDLLSDMDARSLTEEDLRRMGAKQVEVSRGATTRETTKAARRRLPKR